MLLENKNAVIYGAGGGIGSAVDRAFAREGAKVFFAGRTIAKIDALAKEIRAAGGVVETAEVDALRGIRLERQNNFASALGDSRWRVASATSAAGNVLSTNARYFFAAPLRRAGRPKAPRRDQLRGL